MEKQTLGDRLRIFIRSRGLTLPKYGEQIGMTAGQLSHYQTGVNIPDVATLERFAKTGLNLHWLITGVGPMQTEEFAAKSRTEQVRVIASIGSLAAKMKDATDKLGELSAQAD